MTPRTNVYWNVVFECFPFMLLLRTLNFIFLSFPTCYRNTNIAYWCHDIMFVVKCFWPICFTHEEGVKVLLFTLIVRPVPSHCIDWILFIVCTFCRDEHNISALWLQDLSTKLKSAPVDGLIWRLAIVMSHVVHTLGGVKAAAHLWYEFTEEMRYRWENGYTIPG